MVEIDIDDLLSRWDGAWLVDGRPISNTEMDALRNYSLAIRWDRVQRRDCVDCEGPWTDGHCRFNCGRCIFVRDAEREIWRYERHGETRDDYARETHGNDRCGG